IREQTCAVAKRQAMRQRLFDAVEIARLYCDYSIEFKLLPWLRFCVIVSEPKCGAVGNIRRFGKALRAACEKNGKVVLEGGAGTRALVGFVLFEDIDIDLCRARLPGSDRGID